MAAQQLALSVSFDARRAITAADLDDRRRANSGRKAYSVSLPGA